jgi:hypothetical protein
MPVVDRRRDHPAARDQGAGGTGALAEAVITSEANLRCHHPRKRVIQYPVAHRPKHERLWNTGSPGPAYAKASAGPRSQGRAEALAKAASRATTDERLFDIISAGASASSIDVQIAMTRRARPAS